MRYIKSFTNDNAIQAAVDDKSLGKPYVALNNSTGKIDWDSKEIDYSKMYLTIEALGEGSIYWYATAENQAFCRTIEYSKNGGEWVSVTSSNSGLGSKICDANEGDIVMFRGNNTIIWHNTGYGTRFNFGGGLEYKVYGNIMSILYKDDFQTRKSFERKSQYQFRSLFLSSRIIDASNLILPATALTSYSYNSMFEECTRLTTAPELPATTLASNCYAYMFEGCTSLTTAPELPATTLASNCYAYMFKNCSNLNYIKCLANNTGTAYSESWVQNVSPTGTFVKKAGVNWPTGVNGIPAGWTVIEE